MHQFLSSLPSPRHPAKFFAQLHDALLFVDAWRPSRARARLYRTSSRARKASETHCRSSHGSGVVLTPMHRYYSSACCLCIPLNVLTMSPFPSLSRFVDTQLFENQSVVEYWENFATHAFENTTQSVYSHCILLKPSGAPVPATFCFSIRRDIFDLPSLVIGGSLVLIILSGRSC